MLVRDVYLIFIDLTYTTKLERVQEFGAKLTTGKWRAHGDSLLARVGWPPLASRNSYLARKSLGGTLLDKRRQGE